MPYWAELWPSALALAAAVLDDERAVRGRRVLELGCGLGVPSVAAALAGADVLATDWSPEALAATARNAALNGARLDTELVRWDEPGAIVERAPWDLVLASDVLYERRNGEQLLGLLPRLVSAGGEVWLADPERPAAADFVERASKTWSVRSEPIERSRVILHRLCA